MWISPTSIKQIPKRACDGTVGELAATGDGSGAAEHSAFNQRYAKGLTVDQRPGTGGHRPGKRARFAGAT